MLTLMAFSLSLYKKTIYVWCKLSADCVYANNVNNYIKK